MVHSENEICHLQLVDCRIKPTFKSKEQQTQWSLCHVFTASSFFSNRLPCPLRRWVKQHYNQMICDQRNTPIFLPDCQSDLTWWNLTNQDVAFVHYHSPWNFPLGSRCNICFNLATYLSSTLSLSPTTTRPIHSSGKTTLCSNSQRSWSLELAACVLSPDV